MFNSTKIVIQAFVEQVQACTAKSMAYWSLPILTSSPLPELKQMFRLDPTSAHAVRLGLAFPIRNVEHSGWRRRELAV
jgi:hypothetical protein